MTTWIFPSNPDDYEIEKAFLELKIIDWGVRLDSKIKAGDLVYIYRSIGKENPEGRIILKTEVIKENVPRLEIIDDRKFCLRKNFNFSDKKKYIRLKFIGEIFNDEISSALSCSNLKKNGLRSDMQGSIILDNNLILKEYIENTLKDT